MIHDSLETDATGRNTAGRPADAGLDEAGGNTSEAVDPPKSTWAFLTNHAYVLLSVANYPDARVRDIAQLVGITERCVQRILGELEEAGYISRVHHGRRNSYQVHAHLPLRHPSERHRQVSALLKFVSDDPLPAQEGETRG